MIFKIISLIISINFLILAQTNYPTGKVIFIHPDGSGLANWNAVRMLYYGPDAILNWDQMSNIGLYQGHMLNSLTASSHGGATVHAYGKKVVKDSYGMNGDKELTSLSGEKLSIMQEAITRGIKTGIVNSGSIIEPGTGVFVASSVSRKNDEEISKKIIQSGADVIMAGGEEWLLPAETEGRHVESGKRTDELNLINWAEDNGYKVVYDKYELKDAATTANKLIGVFSAGHTFNDLSEEELKEKNLPNYYESAPTIAEMTEAAIEILSRDNQQFFLVAEEEGTDNYGNKNNANGMLEALKNADDAIGVVLNFIEKNPNTLLVTAADSEAGGMEIIGEPVEDMPKEKLLPDNEWNGAPIDGRNGAGTLPFISAADKFGKRFPFRIAWSTTYDASGSVVAKAHGLNAELMNRKIDNTFIYRIMYATLFGKFLKPHY